MKLWVIFLLIILKYIMIYRFRTALLITGKDRMWKDGLGTLKYKLIQKIYKKKPSIFT